MPLPPDLALPFAKAVSAVLADLRSGGVTAHEGARDHEVHVLVHIARTALAQAKAICAVDPGRDTDVALKVARALRQLGVGQREPGGADQSRSDGSSTDT